LQEWYHFVRGQHLISSEYVGKEAAREAAEAFYRTVPVYLETLDDGLLKTYFREDIFASGLNPRDHITAITVFLDCACSPEHPNGKVIFLGLSGDSLSAIFGGKRKIMPKITFVIKEKAPWAVPCILEASLPLYGQLKALGADVSVLYLFRNSDRIYRANAVKLGAVMELPRPSWERHIEDSCCKQYPESKISL
jgi:hypothetical protein